MLVIEHASYLLPWIEREAAGQPSGDAGAVDLVVISQLASEPPLAFATRVMRRIGKAGSPQVLARAVLACGPHSDERSLAARAQIAQALLAAAQRGSGAQLTLAAGPRAPARLRRQLLAIAGTMLEQVASPKITVSVQMGDGTAQLLGPLAKGAEIARKVA